MSASMRPGHRDADLAASESTFAVVPVKPLAEAKSRLASALPPALRRLLVLTMLEDVLRTLAAAPGIGRVLVVTADLDVGELARREGATICKREAASA